METARYPRIVPFEFATREGSWIDERGADEMPMKGWVCIRVEAEEGKYYEVDFFDPVRLQQDMESDIENGKPCFAEYGALVVVPEVTVEAVERSVLYLWQNGHFNYWKPSEKFNTR
jgi:hypothetical protein